MYHRKGAREKKEAKEKLEKMDEGNIFVRITFFKY